MHDDDDDDDDDDDEYYRSLTPLQSNLKLRHECKKLEQAIKRREEVSSELHMIDFEQLKIENQSLNEKIEERNEELLKLRKKTTSTVQVLTHLKEKLQFVQAENQVLKAELTGLEADLGQHRDAVTKVKLQRDQLRQENAKLKASALVFRVFVEICGNIVSGEEWAGWQRSAAQRFRPAQARNREYGAAHDVAERSTGAVDQGSEAALRAVGEVDGYNAEAIE